MLSQAIDVNCVFGRDHYRHLTEILIPSLLNATNKHIRFNVVNYAGPSDLDTFSGMPERVEVSIIRQETGKAIGFAEAHNLLAKKRTVACFYNYQSRLHTS
ncbi:hypothetical protein HGG72_11755 [Ochrobactrum pecoris]|nr:hypothetical protein [Brucella pecoris]